MAGVGLGGLRGPFPPNHAMVLCWGSTRCPDEPERGALRKVTGSAALGRLLMWVGRGSWGLPPLFPASARRAVCPLPQIFLQLVFRGVLLSLCSAGAAEEGRRAAGCARGAFHSCLHSSPPSVFWSWMVGNDESFPKLAHIWFSRRGFVCHFLSLWGGKKKVLQPECLGKRGRPGKEIRSEEMCHQQKAQLFVCIDMAERSPARPAAAWQPR